MIRSSLILSALLLCCGAAVAQEFANEGNPDEATSSTDETDPVATPLIRDVRTKVMADLVSAMNESRKGDAELVRSITQGDAVNARGIGDMRRWQPQVPNEIQEIIPPAVGVDASSGFTLRLHAPHDGDWTAYWHPVASNLDVKVAVTESWASSADYLGGNYNDGILRTDGTISYSSAATAVTLGVDLAWATNFTTVIITNIVTNLVGYGNITNLLGGDIVTNHTDLDFSGSTAGDAGQNLDHDHRYWAHGKTYNDVNGGLWGTSIGYGTGSGTFPAPALRVDLANSLLYDGVAPAELKSIDWNTRLLYNSSEDKVFDYDLEILYDGGSAENKAIDLSNRIMYDSSVDDSVDWENRILSLDSATVVLSWFEQKLYNPAGDTLLTWDGDLAFSPGTSNITVDGNIGQTVADSSGSNLFEHGIFVNDASWTITNITYIAPGGATNTMTVLALVP